MWCHGLSGKSYKGHVRLMISIQRSRNRDHDRLHFRYSAIVLCGRKKTGFDYGFEVFVLDIANIVLSGVDMFHCIIRHFKTYDLEAFLRDCDRHGQSHVTKSYYSDNCTFVFDFGD